MFQVETNKYSHSGSGFSAINSEHENLRDALKVGRQLWSTGFQRWVYVYGPGDGPKGTIGNQRKVYFLSGREFPEGNGPQ